ncbi:MAG: hypothetical protein PVF58_08950 [Candidatus Methanofastidiosia archaeon]
MKKIVLIMLLLCIGCVGQKKDYTKEESVEIARKFVFSSPTYLFDGQDLQHVKTVQGNSPHTWKVTFEFVSNSAGYGDRSGKMVAQVITPHTAVVTVEKGKVIYAVLDGKWDMLNQELID